MKNKIGVGVITCNGIERFKQSISTIPNVDCLVVVNDGNPYPNEIYPKNAEVIQHSKNMSVGVAKNDALRYLMKQDCDHLFLAEDDMLITNPEVFIAYIKAAEASGIWHMNFGYHGPANFKPGQYGIKNPRQVVDYENGIEIALNPHCVGSFSYYLRGIIKTIGYFDERFVNAFDHVENTYKIIKMGLHPPFWWFADIANSDQYIKEQASSDVNSVIHKDEKWKQNFQQACAWFKHKHGYYPTEIPDTPPDKVLEILNTLQKNYARKTL